MTLKKIALFLLILCSSVSIAQKTVTHQSLYWTRFYSQLTYQKWTWHNEFDNRRFFENNRQHHFIMHSRMHYKLLPNADVAAGFTYSRQNPQEPASANSLVVPELRPHQELNLSQTFNKKFGIQHRFRLDERFIHKNNGKTLLDGYDFNFRFRYRLQLNYTLSKTDAKLSTTLKAANELMINAGESIIYNHFDQNRVYLGIEQGISKTLAVELGYLHWFQQRNTGNQFFSREIMRFTLYHRLKL